MKTNNTLTYSLENGSDNAEKYYEDVERFTKVVMQVCEEQAGDLVDEYLVYRTEQYPAQKLLSRNEYLFEALLLGVYYRRYGGYTKGSTYLSRVFMQGLASLRRKGGIYKKIADSMRGRFGMALLMKEKYKHSFLFPSTPNLQRLIHWLEATAEFRPEARRIRNWYEFLKSLSAIESSVYLSVAGQLADWFEAYAEKKMGAYTQHVNDFLEKVRTSYLHREDAISVNKTSVEYHLNMLAAEVMNESSFENFMKTRRKVLLLPPCMRGSAAAGCKATVNSPEGDKCKACNENCAINRYRKLGQQHGFEVFIMHHASRPPDWLKDNTNGQTAVVGVACLTNLVSGGWTLQELNIPAQCVVLNSSGCKHWRTVATATTLNDTELVRKFNGGRAPLLNRPVSNKRKELIACNA
ncbi:MAG: DUF116 domain-containing protein [Bacteroidales bacterium]|nr:DUF116 domain-containing protein [Bacteroidales bacterium]